MTLNRFPFLPSVVNKMSVSGSESDNTSVDSQDMNHVMEDLTIEIVEAEQLREQRQLQEEKNEHNIGARSRSSSTPIDNGEGKLDRVPSAQALSSMFKTFVGDDVAYSIKDVGIVSSPTTDASPLLSVSPDTNTSSVDSGYNGMMSHGTRKVVPEIVPSTTTSNTNDVSQVIIPDKPTAQVSVPADFIEFPWLFYAGFTSTAAFIGAGINMSPIIFVLLVVLVSFISFGSVLNGKEMD